MLENKPISQLGLPTSNTSTFLRVHNSVILPDGSKPESLGSGIITGLLGVGGMANVYEIWNSQLEVTRAVKVLQPNYTKETKQRFDIEIKISAKLHHKNIVEIYAVGYWNGLPYIEMERIDGKTLESLINERGAFPMEVCTAIGVMIGRALQYAHNQDYVIYGKNYKGVIHRDLKPSNIMISNRGVLKLLDFGIARPTDTSINTTDGSILGTLQYLSPEQLEGKDADVRTDIFSIGTLLYEMITGAKAFPEKNSAYLMVSRLKNNFKPLDSFDVKIPLKLKNLVHRCMAKDREKRIKSASAFLSEITKIHKSITVVPPEQVVKQFIGSKDTSKIILTSKYRASKVTLTVFISSGLIFSTLIVYGSQILDYFQKQLEHRIHSSAATQISKPQQPQQVNDSAVINKNNLQPNNPEKTATVVSKSNAERVKPDIKAKVSLVDQLRSYYGTTDLVFIFAEEVKNRKYQTALEIFSELSADQKETKTAVIFRIRLLKKTRNSHELQQLLMTKEINDAEFYLEKARLFLINGNITEAMSYLQITSRTPAAFMENSIIRQERLYLVARCKSLEFDKNPSSKLKNNALESWYELKAELQTNKDHQYYKKADLEMQRITQKIISNKG